MVETEKKTKNALSLFLVLKQIPCFLSSILLLKALDWIYVVFIIMNVLLFHVDNHIILIIHAIIIRYLTLKHFFSFGDDAFNLGRDVFLILTITVLWFRLLRIQYNLYIHEMVLLAELETSAEFSFKLQILWTIIFDFDINKSS